MSRQGEAAQQAGGPVAHGLEPGIYVTIQERQDPTSASTSSCCCILSLVLAQLKSSGLVREIAFDVGNGTITGMKASETATSITLLHSTTRRHSTATLLRLRRTRTECALLGSETPKARHGRASYMHRNRQPPRDDSQSEGASVAYRPGHTRSVHLPSRESNATLPIIPVQSWHIARKPPQVSRAAPCLSKSPWSACDC